jgi:hypothetical protein
VVVVDSVVVVVARPSCGGSGGAHLAGDQPPA